MSKAAKQKYRPSDIGNAQRRYAETRDPMFLAIAVGLRPHQPPMWVIEECAALAEEVASLAVRGNERKRMGRRLDEMWRFFYNAPDNYERDERGWIVSNVGPSLAAAARHALEVIDKLTPECRGFDAANSNLQRAWREERNNCDTEGEGFPFDGLPLTDRSKRILAEWGDGEAGVPYRHVSLHIARHDREGS